MLAWLFGIKPKAGKGAGSFVRGRHVLGGRLAAQNGRFSYSWASDMSNWYAHVSRPGNHGGYWAPALFKWQDEFCLDQQRALNASQRYWSGDPERAVRHTMDGFNLGGSLPSG